MRGIGGIERDCKVCKGHGQVELQHLGGEVIHTFDEFKDDLKAAKEVRGANNVPLSNEVAAEIEKNKVDVLPICPPVIATDSGSPALESEPTQPKDVTAEFEALVAKDDIKKKDEKKVSVEAELGAMMGYTPFMIEAILAEPRMKPDEWRQKYGSIILDPLAVVGEPNKVYLPNANDRRGFRESVALAQPIKPRQYDVMKAQDIAGKLAGID